MANPDDEKTLTKPTGNLLAQVSGPASAALLVLSGQEIGKLYRIDQTRLQIGRSSEADITIEDESVSRLHAAIVRTQEGVMLVDLDSKNGTLVNGQPLKGSRILANGDKLQVGHTTLLRFTLQDPLDEAAAQMLYDSSVRDPLTGIFNRKFLMESLAKEVAYANRHDTSVGLMMMDLDHFKVVNDTHGHPAGDQVLLGVVACVNQGIRSEDVFGRVGGEEFALMLRNLTEDVTVAVAERLRRQVEANQVQVGEKLLSVTMSAGIATYVKGAYASSEAFVAAADGFLLQAKAAGRNRVLGRWLVR